MQNRSGLTDGIPLWLAFAGRAGTYNLYRPGYPEAAVQAIAERTKCFDANSLALDVGCGTGIFTRCLAARLPFQLVGVEPNDDMRELAAASSRGLSRVRFEPGSADSLPLFDDSVVLVTAATAAHWFDRGRFYPEVARVLRRHGTLALIQNKRRYWDSNLLADYESIHERHVPGYERGTFPDHKGGYADANFAEELRHEAGFGSCERLTWQWEELLARSGFLSFSLSSSITQKAIARSGRKAVLDEIESVLDRYAGPGDVVRMPYLTEMTVANCTGSGSA